MTSNRVALFFDMDGVLADFSRCALRAHNHVGLDYHDMTWSFPVQIGFDHVMDPKFWDKLDHEFWANIDPHDDGFALLRAAEELVGEERIGLLTSPPEANGCVDGKREWVGKYMPSYKKRLFVGSAKHLFAGPKKILIDDNDENCHKFVWDENGVRTGGLSVKIPRPWNDRKKQLCPQGHFDPVALAEELKVAVSISTHG